MFFGKNRHKHEKMIEMSAAIGWKWYTDSLWKGAYNQLNRSACQNIWNHYVNAQEQINQNYILIDSTYVQVY